MPIRRGAKTEPDKSIFSQRLTPKQQFSGVSPNLFVGSYGYPFLRVGALSSEEKHTLDTPKDFVQKGTGVQDIISHRQQFINSNLKLHVKELKGRFQEQLQDIAKSIRALDSEVSLAKPLSSSTRFDQKAMPHGPSAELKKLELTSNAKVQRKVESITSDTDIKATTAIQELTTARVDEHQLTKLLSSGTLGQKRKIVPTKWSITAVDDIRSKFIIDILRHCARVEGHYYYGEYLGNTFHIFFLPGAWSFELLEITFPETIYNPHKEFLFSHDYEFPQGRKRYVEETSGAYYAARLAILEYLEKLQQQGRVIVLRCITPDYTAPLGVWVVREGVRIALETKRQELHQTIKEKICALNFDPRLPSRILLSELKLIHEEQKQLFDF